MRPARDSHKVILVAGGTAIGSSAPLATLAASDIVEALPAYGIRVRAGSVLRDFVSREPRRRIRHPISRLTSVVSLAFGGVRSDANARDERLGDRALESHRRRDGADRVVPWHWRRARRMNSSIRRRLRWVDSVSRARGYVVMCLTADLAGAVLRLRRARTPAPEKRGARIVGSSRGRRRK